MRRIKYIAKRRLRCLTKVMHRPRGLNIQQACKKIGISITTYYKWKKRVACMPDSLTALSDRRPSGPLHYKSLKPYQEEAILKVISEHPEYGCKKITESLPKRPNGKPFVSSGGVQKFLERKRLNLRRYRFRFTKKVLQTSLSSKRQKYKEKERGIKVVSA